MPARPFPVLLALLLTVAGCRSVPDDSSPADVETENASVADDFDLAERLRAEGATVESLGQVVTAAFSIPGEALLVNGERVELYRFADAGEASAEVANLTASAVHWLPPARLYQRDGLLAFYAAGNAAVAALLEDVLGAPVASA
jgi:hypothetical protein